jgi:hypothetical protein
MLPSHSAPQQLHPTLPPAVSILGFDIPPLEEREEAKPVDQDLDIPPVEETEEKPITSLSKTLRDLVQLAIDAPIVSSQVEERKTAIALNLIRQELPKLNFSPSIHTLPMKTLIFFKLLELFQMIASQSKVEVKGLLAFVHFLHFILDTPFSTENGKRFSTLFTYLKEHLDNPQVLKDDSISSLYSSLHLLLRMEILQNKTLAAVLNTAKPLPDPKKEEKNPCDIAEEISICRYLISAFFLPSQQILTVMDERISILRHNIETALYSPLASLKRHQLPPQLSKPIHQLSSCRIRTQQLLKIYHIRRSLFMEGISKIHHLLSFRPEESIHQLSLLLKQGKEACHLLNHHIHQLQEQLNKESKYFLLSITEEDEKVIRLEEQASPFKERLNKKERQAKTIKQMNPLIGLFEQSIELRLQEQQLSADPSKGSSAIQASLAEYNHELQRLFFSLQSCTGKMASALQETAQAKKKARQEFLKDHAKVCQKLSPPQETLYRTFFTEKSRDYIRLEVALDSLNQSFALFANVLEELEKHLLKIASQDIHSSSAYLDLLFEDDAKTIRPKKRSKSSIKMEPSEAKELEVELPIDPPPVATVPEHEVSPISKPPQTKGISEPKSLKAMLKIVGDRLTPSSFIHHYASTKVTEEMTLNALPYLQDLTDHFYLLGLSLSLLKASTSQHLVGLRFIVVRYASLVSEDALSAHLLVNKKNAVLYHHHFSLATRLGWRLSEDEDAQWLQNFLAKVNYGVVAHRYAHTVALRFEEKGLPLPGCLSMLISEKTESDPLKELAVQTLEFVERYCISSASHLKTSTLAQKELNEFTIKKKTHPQLLKEKLQKELQPLLGELDHLLNMCQRIVQEPRLDALALAIWRNVNSHVQVLQSLSQLLVEFPQARFLAVHGEAILTCLQYLAEQIEIGLHYQQTGELLVHHDLSDLCTLNQWSPTNEEQAVVDQLNIGKWAQHPHQPYVQSMMPQALSWRFEALALSKEGEKADQQALEELRIQQEGYQKARKGRHPNKPHPLFTLQTSLITLISQTIRLSQQRLRQSLKTSL